MNSGDFTIFTRDFFYNIEEPLDNWLSFTIIMRFNRVGTWNLELDSSSLAGRIITKQKGIIVKHLGVTVFSGSITGDFIRTKRTIKVSGKDDMWLLETPCRPTPSQNFGPYPDAYDVTTGNASTIMRSLVNRNIGPAAPSSWKVPQLFLTADPIVGAIVTCRARFDPLITLLQELASTALAGGMGFRILQSDTVPGQTNFSMYAPRDLHSTTIFSTELGTALDYEYTFQYPESNYFFVAGGDDFGNNRTVVEDGDPASYSALGRWAATFVDKRGVTDISELNQELAEQVATAITSEQVTVIPTPENSLRFYTDYFLGDYVSAIVEGVQYPRIIREIEINFDPEGGPEIKPLLADPGGTNDPSLTRHFLSVQNRILNLEQNWNVPEDSITENMLHPFMKWNPGDIKMTGRAAAQPGWLLCNGSMLTNAAYPRLSAAISNTFGSSGIGFFQLPDLRNRFPVGAGTTYPLGASALSIQIDIAHYHTHSHGLSNHIHPYPLHTHPGNHSHDFDHNHALDSGSGVGSTGTQHSLVTGDPAPHSTDSDNNVFSASYGTNNSYPSPNTTESDSQLPFGSSGGHTNIPLPPPSYTSVNFVIYAGS